MERLARVEEEARGTGGGQGGGDLGPDQASLAHARDHQLAIACQGGLHHRVEAVDPPLLEALGEQVQSGGLEADHLGRLVQAGGLRVTCSHGAERGRPRARAGGRF